MPERSPVLRDRLTLWRHRYRRVNEAAIMPCGITTLWPVRCRNFLARDHARHGSRTAQIDPSGEGRDGQDGNSAACKHWSIFVRNCCCRGSHNPSRSAAGSLGLAVWTRVAGYYFFNLRHFRLRRCSSGHCRFGPIYKNNRTNSDVFLGHFCTQSNR